MNVGNRRPVGKCGDCGGVVSVPTVWLGVVPPRPTCEACGAVEDQTARLPVLPMVPPGGRPRRSPDLTCEIRTDWSVPTYA